MRATALARRTYPGLAPATTTVRSMLLSGLTEDELVALDEYDLGPYDLRKLTLTDGLDLASPACYLHGAPSGADSVWRQRCGASCPKTGGAKTKRWHE